MKDEIKEILDKLEQHISIVSIEDEDLLLDYTTNLQEENERLKEWKKDLLDENIDLENIRKEAIEYIYEHREEALFEYNGKLVYALSDDFDEGDLLNILQGEDKE